MIGINKRIGIMKSETFARYFGRSWFRSSISIIVTEILRDLPQARLDTHYRLNQQLTIDLSDHMHKR
jgi:hypothetical protein